MCANDKNERNVYFHWLNMNIFYGRRAYIVHNVYSYHKKMQPCISIFLFYEDKKSFRFIVSTSLLWWQIYGCTNYTNIYFMSQIFPALNITKNNILTTIFHACMSTTYLSYICRITARQKDLQLTMSMHPRVIHFI